MYTSKYTSRKIGAGQLIAEKICERAAKRKGQTLKEHFWSEPIWKNFFKMQLLQANALLKTYSIEAILRSLDDKRLLSLFSLRSPLLDPILADKQKELDNQAELCYNLQTQDVNSKPKEEFKQKKTLFERLD